MASGAWSGLVVMGVLLAILGGLALGATVFTGLVSVFLLGIALLAAGVLEVAQALRERDRPHRGLHLTGGIFSIVAGALLFARPAAGLATISLLLAMYFIANGLFRSIGAIVDRFPGWGWDLAYGVLALALGFLVVRSWPSSSLWLLGTLVGIEILTRGIMLIALGFETRRLLRGHDQGPEIGGGRPLGGAVPRTT